MNGSEAESFESEEPNWSGPSGAGRYQNWFLQVFVPVWQQELDGLQMGLYQVDPCARRPDEVGKAGGFRDGRFASWIIDLTSIEVSTEQVNSNK